MKFPHLLGRVTVAIGIALGSLAAQATEFRSSDIHPDDYPRVMTVFDDYINRRSPYYQTEYRCRKKDGSYLWIEDSGHVVARNPDGSVARMFGAHRNIDDRKRLVAHLEQRNSSLESLIAERTRELCWVNEQLKRQLDENRDLAEREAQGEDQARHRLGQGNADEDLP